VKALNASGGLGGKQVRLVSCNDQNNPNQIALCARKMVTQKVVAVVGGVMVNGPTATQILQPAGIP